VQIDIDPKKIGLRHPVEEGLVGDCKTILAALVPKLSRRTDRSFLEKAQKGVKEWRDMLDQQAGRKDTPMKPQVPAFELDRLLKDDAIVATDSGTVTAFIARYMKLRGDQKFSCSGNLATMACGLPYAIAAAVAYPERQVVAFVGDGALTMLIGELATCVKYDLNVKVVVIKNNTLGQIRWEQMVFLGNPEYACDLQPIDFAAVARGFGCAGYSIEDPAKCHDVMSLALETPGPAVIECVVDPNEPPMPPKATLKDAENLAKALLRGEPEGLKIATTLAKDKVREMV
jgi:pyruvate dehydrogenase (quinone)/pyruvate oxidase